MTQLAREVASSVKILGKCFIRHIPDNAKNITARTARKYVRIDPRTLPEFKMPETKEACKNLPQSSEISNATY